MSPGAEVTLDGHAIRALQLDVNPFTVRHALLAAPKLKLKPNRVGGGIFITSTPPTLNLLLLLRASV